MAYTASDSKFARERHRYPRFYRMVPLTEQVADGYVALIKQLQWKRVAVISHDDDFNINVSTSIQSIIQDLVCKRSRFHKMHFN